MKTKNKIEDKIQNFTTSGKFIKTYEYDEENVFVSLGDDTIIEIPFSREVLNIIKSIYENQDILINTHLPYFLERIKKSKKLLTIGRLVCLTTLLITLILLICNMEISAFVTSLLTIGCACNNMNMHNYIETLNNNALHSCNNLMVFNENDDKLRKAVLDIYEKQKENSEINFNKELKFSQDSKNLEESKTKVIKPLVNK